MAGFRLTRTAEREDLTDERFRFWSVFDSLIVYEPDASPLVIVRVLHGSRDVRGELDTY